MELINLEGAVKELQFQQKKMNESFEELKSRASGEEQIELLNEAISLSNLYFDILKHGLEEHLPNYETAEQISKRLKIEGDKVERAMKRGDLKVISVLDPEQFVNMKTVQFHDILNKED